MKKKEIDIEAVDTTVAADFTKKTGKIRKALHSSGWTPRSSPRSIQNDDEAVKALNMTYTRTHDWALVSPGQRIVDYQYIFPLFDKDATDPTNYYFAPTDYILELSRSLGLKIFYRLGTSIEHTQGIHFNAAVPTDFEKTAEIFASIIRHYNKGWANGKKWDIKYWEIWNEPDGVNNMWCDPVTDRELGKDPEGDAEWDNARRDRLCKEFVKFFVICLKRIKSEFPDIKVGGPALWCMNADYFCKIFQACKDAGVAPDFIAWHYYGSNPDQMISDAVRARAICDKYGFTKCELFLDEWHYILDWDGVHGRNSTPAMVRRAFDGPTGHNQIDSACFTLTALTKFQTSLLDQAYFHGCAHQGAWGYMDDYKNYNKNWYAFKLFGGIIKDYPDMCASASSKKTVSTLAVKSADGKKLGVLVTDYRGTEQVLTVAVKGAEKAKGVSAVVLDDTRDLFPIDVKWHNGVVTLVKPDKNSSSWFIEFEL